MEPRLTPAGEESAHEARPGSCRPRGDLCAGVAGSSKGIGIAGVVLARPMRCLRVPQVQVPTAGEGMTVNLNVFSQSWRPHYLLRLVNRRPRVLADALFGQAIAMRWVDHC